MPCAGRGPRASGPPQCERIRPGAAISAEAANQRRREDRTGRGKEEGRTAHSAAAIGASDSAHCGLQQSHGGRGPGRTRESEGQGDRSWIAWSAVSGWAGRVAKPTARGSRACSEGGARAGLQASEDIA